MAPQVPTKEGKIPFEIPGRSEFSCFTYYKVYGDLDNSIVPPLVMLHGGPGAGHECLLSFAELWPQYGIPVIFYDQIGCGSSTHLPQTAGDQTLWNVSLFISELNNVLDHFNLRQPDGHGYHILGQSWGGILAADFATSRPVGLKKLILASGLASRELSIQGYELRRQELPPDTVRIMKECEAREDYENPAYIKAMETYMDMFLYKERPYPPELLQAFKNLAEDKTVQRSMYVQLTYFYAPFLLGHPTPSPMNLTDSPPLGSAPHPLW